jgi:hypothetical protein
VRQAALCPLPRTLAVSVSRPTNSQIEKYYFEKFRGDYPLPEGAIEYTDKPDVIVRGQSTLGIEITSLYIASGSEAASEQVQRRRREQVLQRAQAIFLDAGGARMELSVDFDPRRPIEQVESVARALSDVALQPIGFPTGPVKPTHFGHIEPLRSVFLNAHEYPDAKWRLIQSFTVPSLSIERVREVVAEKSEKLPAYQPCERYWLLVVIDLMDVAQDQHLDWPMGATLGASPYEKVLLYKPQYQQVLVVPQ